MAKVLGIGGVFFKVADPAATREWYARVLGVTFESWGGVMFEPLTLGSTTLSPFAKDTKYFAPSTQDFSINLVVDDLNGILERAAAQDVLPFSSSEDEFIGRFASILDPDGIRNELWEPLPS